MDAIWNYLKGLTGATDAAPPVSKEYQDIAKAMKEGGKAYGDVFQNKTADRGFGSYGPVTHYKPDGSPYQVMHTRLHIPAYESDDQRKFVMATRRGASQDPNFTQDEAHDFIHSVMNGTKRG